MSRPRLYLLWYEIIVNIVCYISFNMIVNFIKSPLLVAASDNCDESLANPKIDPVDPYSPPEIFISPRRLFTE